MEIESIEIVLNEVKQLENKIQAETEVQDNG